MDRKRRRVSVADDTTLGLNDRGKGKMPTFPPRPTPVPVTLSLAGFDDFNPLPSQKSPTAGSGSSFAPSLPLARLEHTLKSLTCVSKYFDETKKSDTRVKTVEVFAAVRRWKATLGSVICDIEDAEDARIADIQKAIDDDEALRAQHRAQIAAEKMKARQSVSDVSAMWQQRLETTKAKVKTAFDAQGARLKAEAQAERAELATKCKKFVADKKAQCEAAFAEKEAKYQQRIAQLEERVSKLQELEEQRGRTKQIRQGTEENNSLRFENDIQGESQSDLSKDSNASHGTSPNSLPTITTKLPDERQISRKKSKAPKQEQHQQLQQNHTSSKPTPNPKSSGKTIQHGYNTRSSQKARPIDSASSSRELQNRTSPASSATRSKGKRRSLQTQARANESSMPPAPRSSESNGSGTVGGNDASKSGCHSVSSPTKRKFDDAAAEAPLRKRRRAPRGW